MDMCHFGRAPAFRAFRVLIRGAGMLVLREKRVSPAGGCAKRSCSAGNELPPDSAGSRPPLFGVASVLAGGGGVSVLGR